ncbi:MAG: hypothetical protein ACO1Q7_08780 [Gemmatimonas sp.]
MRTHIKVVALINILMGALGVLGGVAAFVGGTFGSIFSGSFVAALVGTVASTVIGLVIACLSAVSIVAGFGLLNGKPWARTVIIVLSVLHLFSWPWRTIFGAYSLWVLLSSDGQREYQTISV